MGLKSGRLPRSILPVVKQENLRENAAVVWLTTVYSYYRKWLKIMDDQTGEPQGINRISIKLLVIP